MPVPLAPKMSFDRPLTAEQMKVLADAIKAHAEAEAKAKKEAEAKAKEEEEKRKASGTTTGKGRSRRHRGAKRSKTARRKSSRRRT